MKRIVQKMQDLIKTHKFMEREWPKHKEEFSAHMSKVLGKYREFTHIEPLTEEISWLWDDIIYISLGDFNKKYTKAERESLIESYEYWYDESLVEYLKEQDAERASEE